MKTCPVEPAGGMGFGPDVCYYFWDGGVGPLVPTPADRLGSKERLDSAGKSGTLQNTKYGHT